MNEATSDPTSDPMARVARMETLYKDMLRTDKTLSLGIAHRCSLMVLAARGWLIEKARSRRLRAIVERQRAALQAVVDGHPGAEELAYIALEAKDMSHDELRAALENA